MKRSAEGENDSNDDDAPPDDVSVRRPLHPPSRRAVSAATPGAARSRAATDHDDEYSSSEKQQNTVTSNSSSNEEDLTSVQVAVRIRPTLEDDDDDCIRCLPPSAGGAAPTAGRGTGSSSASVVRALQIGGSQGPTFTFDRVFGKSSRQSDLYHAVVAPLVSNCLEGYNATVLAYGQTSSGKTYTIMGESLGASAVVHDQSAAGIIPRAFDDMFRRLEAKSKQQRRQKRQSSSLNRTAENSQERSSGDGEPAAPSSVGDSSDSEPSYAIKLQFLELYGEEIRDLLLANQHATSTHHKLTIREVDGEPEVLGATQQVVQTPQEALMALNHGMVRRVTGATAMNSSSSRSHAILTVLIEQQTPTRIQSSKFQFVDLAGSERQKRTGAQGQRLREGIDINKGLLVLGNVISALASNSSFVPYRDSKLTRMLQGSLGGNHKTLMIACVSPAPVNLEESLNCLRYANRAKNITNQARVNASLNWEKVVERLQSQLAVVARAILRAMENGFRFSMPRDGDGASGPSSAEERLQAALLSYESLQALARGQLLMMEEGSGPSLRTGANGSTTPRFAETAPSGSPLSAEALPLGMELSNDDDDQKLHQRLPIQSRRRLQDLEDEVNHLRGALARTQKNQEEAEQELYHAKAQKQVLEMQLAVNVESLEAAQRSSVSSSSVGDDGEGPKGIASDDSRDSKWDQQSSMDSLFVQRASEYEREIGELKRALSKAEDANRASRLVDWKSGNRDASSDPGVLQRFYEGVEEDKRRLEELRCQLRADQLEGQAVDTPRTRMDKEERAEEAQLQNLTRKYLQDHDDEDGEQYIDEPQGDTGEPDVAASDTTIDTRLIRADLVELSRNIAAKEDLIGQLRLSQEKYSTMRDFYEGRLQQMEEALIEKEAEREHLVRELQQSQGKHSDGSRKVLEERLKEKESELAALRKHQKELKELTRVSSRNSTEIQRLQEEVVTMKRRKAEMQNQLGHERKHHISEKKQMEKTMMQKDREANKWQKLSVQHEIQAQRANQVAKARLEEISNLRSKYKDAEKKIRILSLKRGVMEKAGLNPVMVGRRRRESMNKDDANTGSRVAQPDVDSLRDIFDQKVAEIVRKEAIADKLANEWEEHFELKSRRDDLLQRTDEYAEDEAQSLSIQIQFKEDRIRQLAQRMGKRVGNSSNDDIVLPTSNNQSFLFDSTVERVFADCSPEERQSLVISVLFGMVVRERRRVAALARAASSLDERAQASEKAAHENEEALRSYMSEQKREVAALKQSQQEQILSLMDLVKQSTSSGSTNPGIPGVQDGNDGADRKLLVLANERISLLEHQLDEVQSSAETADSYRERMDELSETVIKVTQESEATQQSLSEMRTVLRQIRELVVDAGHQSSPVSDGHVHAAILEIVNGTLHPRQPKSKSRPRATPTQDARSAAIQRAVSPRMKKHVELMHTSDSEEDGDAPEWAAEIMNDLACIAAGEVPPSLRGSSYQRNSGADAYDPNREDSAATIAGQVDSPRTARVSPRRNDRIAMSNEIAARLDQIVIPEVQSSDSYIGDALTPPSTSLPSSRPTTSQKSVFERLMTPSHFTGTQKDRFQSQQAKKVRAAKDPASKLLDDLLQSDQESSRWKKDKSTAPPKHRSSEYTQQDVFERLTKTTTHAYAVKQNNPNRSEAATQNSDKCDEMLDELLRSDNEMTLHQRPDEGKGNRTKAEYVQQDVFERLTKTTTQAFAVKQNDPAKVTHAAPKMEAHANESEKDTALDDSQRGGEFARQPILSKNKAEYIQQDVFERLQRTTTHAYAVKHIDAHAHSMDDRDYLSPPVSLRSVKTADDASPTHTISSRSATNKDLSTSTALGPPLPPPPRVTLTTERAPASQYTSQDVFERLQKTTTEAYAKKTTSRHDEV